MTAHITLSQANSRALTGSTMPVMESIPDYTETIAPTSTSQRSTIAVPSGIGAETLAVWIWSVTSDDDDIWVAFGASATAVAGTHHLVLAGQTRFFGASVAGEKIAVILK